MPIVETTEEEATGMGGTDNDEDGGGGDDGGDCKTSKKLMLQCFKPNSKRRVKFEARDFTATDHKLDCYTFWDVIPKYKVKNTSVEQNGSTNILEFVNYDTTLKDWLASNNSLEHRLCPVYLQWKVNRPSHDTRKIIIGILECLEDLISREYSHGALHNTENYAIKYLPNHENVQEREKVKVTFMYVNMEKRCLGHNFDVWAVWDIIFCYILEETEFPKDLIDLKQSLCYEWLKNMKFISSHSSLWHYKDRISYFDRLMKLYKQGSPFEKESIEKAFQKLPSSYDNWRNETLPGPLDSVRNHKPPDSVRNNKPYSPKLTEIGRYFRNTFEHIKDVRPRRHFHPVLEREWNSMQYVEHMLTKHFPELLLELHKDLFDIFA